MMFIMPVTNWHLDVYKGKDNTMLQLLKGLSILYMMKKKIQTRSILVGWSSTCSTLISADGAPFLSTDAAHLSQSEMVQGYLGSQGSRGKRKHKKTRERHLESANQGYFKHIYKQVHSGSVQT